MNNQGNILRLIQRNFHKFSKAQKIIAQYIYNNYEKAAFMTAATLGEALNISESTVVRFASFLGYAGYREMQRDLHELVKNKLTTVQRINLEGHNLNEQDLMKVMERDIDNIRKSIDELDYDSFQEAIDIIMKSKNIYVIGLRSSSFISGYLHFYLSFLFDNVRLVTSGPNDIFEQLVKITKEDVVIGISYPRYSKKTLESLDYAKDKGCSIISITDSEISPAARISDVNLIAISDMASFVDSLVAPMSLINSFIIALGNEKKEDITKYFEDLENVWKKYNVYNDEDNIEG